jgi:two-component system OmpR family response regulator
MSASAMPAPAAGHERCCLLVDDDPQIRELLADYLPRFGLRLRSVADGRGLRQALAEGPVHALLLDLMLPGEDGLSLCRWLRQQPDWHALPVLMLTAQGDPASRVTGLALGADDYLAKPFEPRELVARLQALLRRAAGHPLAVADGSAGAGRDATRLRIGGWLYDRLQRSLSWPDGPLLALSAAECRLLDLLARHPRQVLGRDWLLAESSAGEAPAAGSSSRSIDLAVSRLRAKLERCGGAPPLAIQTLRGQGYLLDADVGAA